MLTLCLCWNETYCTILAQFLNLFPNAYYFNLINDKFLSFQMLSICYASGIRSKVTPMNAEYPYQLLSLKNPCQECKLSVKTVSGREPRLQWYHSGRLSSPQEFQPLGAYKESLDFHYIKILFTSQSFFSNTVWTSLEVRYIIRHFIWHA